MSKKIYYQREAQDKLLSGINQITEAVATTLGPRGHNVGLRAKNPSGLKPWDDVVVHDGVTVAKAIELADYAEDFGASLIKQAAETQVDEVGDGTTVVSILAQAIASEALKVTSAGVNAMSLRAGLEEGTKLLVDNLSTIAKPIKTLEETIQIASISAEDPELGQLIGTVLHQVGPSGVVTVEESKSAETVVEHQEGMQFDKGYISHYFITDPDRMEATVEDTYILVTDQNVAIQDHLVPLIQQLEKVGAVKLVVIAPNISDTALAFMTINKLQGRAGFLAVQAPLFGPKQKDWLDDIAILTGGTVISAEAGMKIENTTLEQLGKAGRVTSTKDATLIVDGRGEPRSIAERILSLQAELERAQQGESGWEAEKVRERIAKLQGGVAVIRVGGHTEIEMKERKERALDAVAATTAAVEDGIVAGGEVAYLQVLKALDDKPTDPAYQILRQALKQPFARLLANAGLDAGEYLRDVLATPIGWGIDVLDGQLKDLLLAGIVDPVKVPKCAIRNAVSVAIQVMTQGALVVPEPEEPKQ